MTLKERILDISMLAGAATAIFTSMLAGEFRKMDEAPESAFRLHIIASSDSYKDQKIKYELRDYMLDELSGIFSGCDNKEEAMSAAQDSLEEIADLCGVFLKDHGYTGGAVCTVEKSDFPTRSYSGYTLPAGEYDALKIIIGEGEGRNWWCVLYPSMCLDAASPDRESVFPKNIFYEEKKRSCTLTSDSLSGARKGIEIKFALYELIKVLFDV